MDSLVHALVAGIAEGRVLIAMQQRNSNVDVTHVGCGAHHRVYQPRRCTHVDMRLHAEIPLIALLGLLHLRVARVVRVLGRIGR